MTYAKGTSVSPDKSKAEIEKLLKRYGAEQFISGWDREQALIGFLFRGRQIRLRMTMPPVSEFLKTETGRARRKLDIAEKARDQAHAERWRALALVIKAKLEAIESGVSTFEDEFLAYTMLPSGQTMGQWAAPQVDEAYASGKMPKLLPGVP